MLILRQNGVFLQTECSVPALPLVRMRMHERKVRAAQDAPLLKMEAAGDGRIRQKKITAAHVAVRVRRWRKRPPGGRRLPCRAVWRLQVRVYRRPRVVRPNLQIRRRVECFRHGVTYAVDKWQALHGARASCRTEPGLQGHCFLFMQNRRRGAE